MPYKQVILVRQDLKLPKGKLAAQAAHAAVEAAAKSGKRALREWNAHGSKKIVLKVPGEAELLQHKSAAENLKLATALIKDAGRTVLRPGTTTCLAIGPAESRTIDKVTGKLKPL